MQRVSKNSALYDEIPSNLLIFGTNGRIYSQNGSYPIYSITELWHKEYLQKANSFPNKINYTVTKDGYFVYTKNERVLIVSKAIKKAEGTIYGYALMMIREADFSKFYANLLDASIDQLWIYQQNHLLVSTNQSNYHVAKFYPSTVKRKASTIATIHQIKLNSFNYQLLLNTNDLLVAKEVIILPTLLMIIFTVICIILPLTFFIMKRRIAPIYELANHLAFAVEGDFSKKAPHMAHPI